VRRSAPDLPAPWRPSCLPLQCGGKRQCGEAAGGGGGGGAFDASELVCGECSMQANGNKCLEHGSAFVEHKCRCGHYYMQRGALRPAGVHRVMCLCHDMAHGCIPPNRPPTP